MKINQSSTDPISKPQSSGVFETAKSYSNPFPAAGRADDAGDKIDLKSQASLLSQAQSAGAADQAANVERLRALVQSGQYQVDPTALSRSIVNAAVNGY
jgi:flagellar biosynthesis anti-sigma factor FlgM